MTREEKIAKLKTIELMVADLTMTYDMGMQFSILTRNGATTTMGDYEDWPISGFRVTDNLRKLHDDLLDKVGLSNEQILEEPLCRELYTLHGGDVDEPSEDDQSKNIDTIIDELMSLDLDGDNVYVFASLAPWNFDIRLFDDYDSLVLYCLDKWEYQVNPYDKMSDEEIDYWYDVAENNDWNTRVLPLYDKEQEGLNME